MALDELQPDVLVVPEARATSGVVTDTWQFHYKPYLNKGIGVFVQGSWSVEVIEPPDGIESEWLLPLRLSSTDPSLGSFVLLAFWALGSRSVRLPTYSAQFTKVLQTWSGVIASEPTVVAGDFNASGRSPRHLVNLAMAGEQGLVSAYHAFHDASPGDEPAMTLKWVGRGRTEFTYHCDLVLLPSDWVAAIRSAEVGRWDEWVRSGRSDHAPVMVDLDDAILSGSSPPARQPVR
jgi:hypothetical protein